jgi:hypothetical protein
MNIYHFTRLNTAIEKILPNMALKFNSIRKTNDPREYYAWSFPSNKESSDSEDLFAQSLQTGKEIRENCKILCFNKEISGYKNLMMWAHYGDNHRGICLEIDEEKFLKTNSETFNSQKHFFYDKIDYRKDEPSPSFSVPTEIKTNTNKIIDKYYKELFFTKSECWQEEQEYRILVKAEENINLICELKNNLKRVILGLDFPWVYLPSVEYLCKVEKIPLYRSFYLRNKIRIYKHTQGNYKPEFHQQYDNE